MATDMFINETDLLKIKSLMRGETEPDCILKELIPFFRDTFILPFSGHTNPN